MFISHVTPDDNDFTLWLSTRLQLAGYKVWCDLGRLKGGERDYWKNIETEIRDDSCKFLLVVSKLTFERDGVLDEFEFAKSIAKEHPELIDFIIPLKIDDTPFNARIGQNRYNHIMFMDSWAKGLKLLLEKLNDDKVPKQQFDDNNPLHLWRKNKFTTQFGIIPRKESYYSNWWPIQELPESLYCHQYETEEQAAVVLKECVDYPIIRHGKSLVTFEDSMATTRISTDGLKLITDDALDIKSKQIYRVQCADILTGYDSEVLPTCADAQYLLKRVLNRTFHLIMKKRGLFWHEMAGKTNCYFYPVNKLYKNKTTLMYPNRKKTKSLVGTFLSSKWHFGVSVKTRLFPVLCFSLKTHILFSDDGLHIWDDKIKLHSARRKKGKTWFNEEWRDQLLAFISGLKTDDAIRISLNKDFVMEMPVLTTMFESGIGYRQPRTKDRQDILEDMDEEWEYYENMEADTE